MKKFVVVGRYHNNANEYVMGSFDTIEAAEREIKNEYMVDPEVDIEEYEIKENTEIKEVRTYW